MAAWVINQIKTKRNNNILKLKKTLNGCSLYVYRFLHDHVTRCMNNRSCFAFLQIHKTPWTEGFFIVELFNSASLFINLLVRHFLFAYEWENGDRNNVRFVSTPSMPGPWVGFLMACQIPTQPIQGNRLQTYNRAAQHMDACHPIH